MSEPTIPDPPSSLSDRSKALWRAVTYPNCPLGRLAAIESALKALDLADASDAILAVEGLTTTNAATNVRHVHPLTKVSKDARSQFHRTWANLGLDGCETKKPYQYRDKTGA